MKAMKYSNVGYMHWSAPWAQHEIQKQSCKITCQ